MNATPDYYEILGVRPEADGEEIRAAYRVQLRRWHPDLAVGRDDAEQRAATEMSATINEAYEVLGDTRRRAVYDSRRGLAEPLRPAPNPPVPPPRQRRRNRRLREVIIIALGGIVAPLFGLGWASGVAAVGPPANPALVAAFCAAVVAVTTWVLAASLLDRNDRLGRIGAGWSHLMRWSGWAVIAAGTVFLGIPAFLVALAAVAVVPFFGLIFIALVLGRFDTNRR